jgi:hypothetical protein
MVDSARKAIDSGRLVCPLVAIQSVQAIEIGAEILEEGRTLRLTEQSVTLVPQVLHAFLKPGDPLTVWLAIAPPEGPIKRQSGVSRFQQVVGESQQRTQQRGSGRFTVDIGRQAIDLCDARRRDRAHHRGQASGPV